MPHFTLLPAYGRDYKSAKAARADFEANKDFEDASFDASGRYINKSCIPDGASINLRFHNATKVAVFKNAAKPQEEPTT